MEEERDIVCFSDDEGNEFELEIIDYFDYEEQEYAVLVDPQSDEESEGEEEEEHETEVYIMKIVVNGEFEEFLPADEDKMEVLTAIVEQRMEQWDEEGCECEEDGCSCGCGCEDEKEKEHDCGCGCGCHD